MRAAHVYVMQHSAGVVKVGCSIAPDRRRWELGGLELLHSTPVHALASRIERMAHRLLELDGKRVNTVRDRELFAVSLEEAKVAIERAERIVAGLEPNPESAPKETLTIRLLPDDVRVLDAIRRDEDDLPNRSQMVRRLISRAAKSKGLAANGGGEEAKRSGARR